MNARGVARQPWRELADEIRRPADADTRSESQHEGVVVIDDLLRLRISADGGRYIMGGVRTFAATDPAQTTADAADYTIRTQNLYGVTTFDIADRYILDALIRQDGSSLFGEENPWSTYFRVSGAWRVTEDFQLPGVDELRLRASYGTAGLRPGFNYQYELLTSKDGAIVKESLGNPQLKPARSGEFEVGANLTFGGSRYALEYNYSRKETTDQIVQLQKVAGVDASAPESMALAG